MKKPELIAEEAFGGSKKTDGFFSIINDDVYAGYCTAMLLRDNPKSGLSVEEWFCVVKKLISEGKL